MSRFAHRNIEHAYTKAGMADEFQAAHGQAKLSDRVKQNKWYSRWWRSVAKFFGGAHDQQINKTVFKQADKYSRDEKTTAMRIQKIYGFIRFITTLSEPTTESNAYSFYQLPMSLNVMVFSYNVSISNSKSNMVFSWNEKIDFTKDRIPPFSQIDNALYYLSTKAITQDIYRSIIELSKTFVPPPSMQELIQEAYKRAGRQSQFNRARLTDQETINKTAFGQGIMNQSAQNRVRAKRIQEIYKFIRLVNRLLEPKNFGDPKMLHYELSTVVIQVYSNAVQIFNNSDINEKIVFQWQDEIDLASDKIPAFSKITNAKDLLQDRETINPIYKAIIAASRTFI